MSNSLRPTLTLIGLTALLASCGTSSQAPASPSGTTAPSVIGALALPSDAHPIQATSASSSNGDHAVTSNAWDDQLSTWWGADGLGEWVRFDLGSEKTVDALSLAWYRGDQRTARFDIELSRDGETWSKASDNTSSSGRSLDLERYNINDQKARYVRVVNHGNSENSAIGITEVVVHSASSNGDDKGRDDTPSSSGQTYYVDCDNGNDSDNGKTSGEAWASLHKVNRSDLDPGDRLLLKRGCSWAGPLNAHWSGKSDARIVIDAYGSGNLPLIRNGLPGAITIRGSYKTIQNVRVTADKPDSRDTGRCNGPVGWTVGFSFTSGSHHNTVQNSQASGLTAGVHLEDGATSNRVLRNRLTDNTVMSKNNNDNGNNDSGAWGVLINGDNNEVAYNYFEGNTACSEDYGVEGASLELYYAKRNYFHHNTSINDTTFAELGGSRDNRSEYNRFEYNVYAPLDTNGRGEALVVRGSESKWGSNPGTVFNNNTVFNSNLGVFCGDGCNEGILTLKDNIIVTRRNASKDTVWTDGPINESGNVYYQLDGERKVTINGKRMSSSSIWSDPRMQEPWDRKFELRSDAPKRLAGALPLP
ncbi:discoidin domain-containing protein [Deinococcus peraridilitoris]|uniref:F5/8 type C domain-containing protein n=1 Tax=Deinococcus peraridilitoris (strain DSM 19664 / LMG 22246 / CIP 109416 / KR-200) TaxID=937777 RepID=L0A936_DEIPD|nr:discoidin domain-containing protein [Deinococcus peraridilitoris]AFZ69632.1 F5/8 type C domain-containing protein [Deinococcus peraridilitoris DSM 19664]